MDAAHLHLILNHFPILSTFFGFMLIGYSFLQRSSEVFRAALAVFIMGGLLAIPAFISGKGAEDIVEDLPGVSENIIEAHESFAATALICSIILAVISAFGLFSYRTKIEDHVNDGSLRNRFGGINIIYVLVVLTFAIITTGVTSYTGNLGGQIRHTELRTDSINEDENEHDEEENEEEPEDDDESGKKRKGRDH